MMLNQLFHGCDTEHQPPSLIMPLLTIFKLLFLSILSFAFYKKAMAVPDISISGFATIAIAQTITDDKKESTLEGMSNAIEFGYFNKLGLRLDTQLASDLAITLQMIANGNKSYQPEVDWAFIDYHITDHLKLSAGKLRLPLYMNSEFKDVSYAYQWIVPPYSVYGAPSFGSFDGATINHLVDISEQWTANTAFWVGQLEDTLEVGGIGGETVNLDIDNIFGASFLLDRDWLTLRAVYMQGATSSDIAPLFISQLGASPKIDALITQLGKNNGIPLSDILLLTESSAITLEKDKTQMLGLGILADYKAFFFNAEATYIHSEPNIIVGDAYSYYFMAGFRVQHDLSFSFTLAGDINRPSDDALDKFKADFYTVANASSAYLTANEKTELHQQAEDILIRAYSTLDTKSYIVSSRWDFHPSASLKAEYLFKRLSLPGEKYTPQAIRMAIDLVF